jgi:hypothetical protein
VTIFFPNLPQFFNRKHHFFRRSVTDSKPRGAAHIPEPPQHSICIWLYCNSTSQRCNSVPVHRYTRDQDQSGYKMKFGPNRRISVTRFIKDALIRVLQCCSPLAHKLTHTHSHTNKTAGRGCCWYRHDSVTLCSCRDWYQVHLTVQFRSRRIFKGGKIISTPSFGKGVKPWFPCHRFAACKRSLKCTVEVGILG